MAAAIEAAVEHDATVDVRVARRMELAEELIEARAAAEGRLPRTGASPAEWAAYYDRYAPLRSSLYDLSMPPEDIEDIIEQHTIEAFERVPTPDDVRRGEQAGRALGVAPIPTSIEVGAR